MGVPRHWEGNGRGQPTGREKRQSGSLRLQALHILLHIIGFPQETFALTFGFWEQSQAYRINESSGQHDNQYSVIANDG